MADQVPRPLLVALGALDELRRLPVTALQLPLVALTAFDRIRHRYDLLALRGQAVMQERFGDEAAPEAAVPVVEAESFLVADAVAHVTDPLDAPHTPHLPEPIPGYDGMTLGSLRGHLRTLTVADLERIARYEKAHLGRAPILTLVEHRLAKLALS